MGGGGAGRSAGQGLKLPGGQRREGSSASLACFWAPTAHARLAAWSALATGHPVTFSSRLEVLLSHMGAGLGALKIAGRWGQAGSYY